MDVVEQRQEENTRKRLSVRAIALSNDVPPSTLDAHIKGRRSMAEYLKQCRLLTEQEDIVLVEHVKMSGERAFPLSCTQIRGQAETLVKACNPLA